MKVSASLAALAALAGVVVVVAAPIHKSPEAMTDILVFETPLAEFTAQRKARDPRDLDWSSDGCTCSLDYPFGFHFRHSCQRHDFGYRNYKHQGRWNETLRERVDKRFKGDLHLVCQGIGDKPICKALANIYFLGARLFGRLTVQKRSNSTDAAELALHEEYAEAKEVYYRLLREAEGRGEYFFHA